MEAHGRLGTWIRAEIALIVSGILALISAFIVPPSEDYLGYVDVPMLCILFCLMATVAGMSECGLFRHVSARMVSKASSARILCSVLVALPFIASMAITNDVALITFVPLAVAALVGAGRKDLVIPTLVMQTAAANLGSILTPIGNPQNLFIFSRYGPGIGDFVLEMLPYALVGGAVLFIACAFVCKGPSKAVSTEVPTLEDRRLLGTMALLFVLSVASVAGLVPFWLALACTAAAMALLKPSLFGKVDYSLLLTFVFLFVFTGNVARMEEVASVLGGLMDSQPLLTPVFASQFISNVPAAVMLSGFTGDWQSLLAGVNIGGFGTPIASMASLITFRLYAKGEVHNSGRFMAVFLLCNAAMLALLVSVSFLLRRGRYLLRCTLSGLYLPSLGTGSLSGYPTAMRQKGLTSSGRHIASDTASILSGCGAMPIQTVPMPLDFAARRMFWVAAARSCCHIMAAFMKPTFPRTTMALGALPTGDA